LKKASEAQKVTPKSPNLTPVLQLSQAKPQPSSKKLDATMSDQALRKYLMEAVNPEMREVIKIIPDEQIRTIALKHGLGQGQTSAPTAKLNKLNITERTTTNKGGNCSASPILIDDEPNPARAIVQKQTPSPKQPIPKQPTPSVQKPSPVPFPSKTTPSVIRTVSVNKPAPPRTTPTVTPKPPGSLVQKALLKQTMPSTFSIQNIISKPSPINNSLSIPPISNTKLNNIVNKPNLATIVSRPNNTPSRPLSAILGDHSDVTNSPGVPLKTLKSFTDMANKLNYKGDKTL